MRNVMALLLAGGKGSRLEPLTKERAKPAVPFGGCYRIIDFTLSNCINSGLRRIQVLTQYKAASLDRHLNLAWRFLCRELGEFIDILPPQQRLADQWYQGTADAVYQNIYNIEQHQPEHLLILSGDHIYKMDYASLVKDHVDSNADATIACIPVPLEEGYQFGVMEIDETSRIVDFSEKPPEPKPMPDDPEKCLASMGIYVFKTRFLLEQLCEDATHRDSSHDFGKNIIPSIINTHLVRAYPFSDKNTGDGHYWRDVGTLDAYYDANMDLVSVNPLLNLYDQSWNIHTYREDFPPPKTVFAQREGVPKPRIGQALDSIICAGTIISGGRIERCIVSPACRINSWAEVEDSILLDHVIVGRDAKIRRAIIDKDVNIPAGMKIGYDHDEDRRRGFTITESGIVVVGKMGDLSLLEDREQPSSDQ